MRTRITGMIRMMRMKDGDDVDDVDDGDDEDDEDEDDDDNGDDDHGDGLLFNCNYFTIPAKVERKNHRNTQSELSLQMEEGTSAVSVMLSRRRRRGRVMYYDGSCRMQTSSNWHLLILNG